MRSIKLFFLCLITCCVYQIQATRLILIVHGTWATHAKWPAPGGYFFDAVEKSVLEEPDTHIIPFTWSGSHTHSAREQAAKNLVKIIHSYPIDTDITIIAHSHGSNVAILASHMLGQQKNNPYIISAMYGLSTPIHTSLYFPDMNVITHFYNFFSLKDTVQPVGGLFQRTFPLHKRIANIHLMLNGKAPNHRESHSELMGKWILSMDKFLRTHHAKNLFAQSGVIYLGDNHKPIYTIYNNRA
ncbi:MAG: alpha/beta hydrolase [Candidatus Dependentiae bacterium]|nr:alpha/beta hydrolase [Candidatus Dependentiae bacterium]